MATNFTNSFTGKNTASVLPSGENLQRSQEKMSDLILGAEKLKYDTFKKNEEEFLKNANIDPIFALTDKTREYQAKLLDKFSNDWGRVYKERGGNLNMEDKIKMAREKDFILMEQGKMKSDYDRFIQDTNIIDKDFQGKLDRDKYEQARKEYLNGGTYSYNAIEPRGVSMGEWYNKASNKVNGTPGNIVTTRNVNGIPLKETMQASGTKEEALRKVETDLLGNDALAKQTINEFLSLKEKDPATYKKYLDINGDNVVSPEEEKQGRYVSNPILEWAKDTYWPQALDMKLSQPSTLNRGTGAGGGGDMRTWNGQKYTPTSAQESPFPSLQSTTYHPFPNLIRAQTIPIGRMEKLEPDKVVADVEQPKQSIKGYVTGYDEGSDKITFMISQDYKDLDYASLASGKGMQVAVPRSAFSKEIFDNLEIVKDGKLTKLKDIATPTPTKAPSNPWDKYKRKNGQ